MTLPENGFRLILHVLYDKMRKKSSTLTERLTLSMIQPVSSALQVLMSI